MKLTTLLEQHSKDIKTDLHLNQEGVCHIVTNGVTVSLEESEDHVIFIYTQIAKLSEKDNGVIFERLLQANLYGVETEGAVFALDTSGTQVILFCRLASEHLEYPAYRNQFDQFVEQTQYWKDAWSEFTLNRAPSSGERDAHEDSHPRIKP